MIILTLISSFTFTFFFMLPLCVLGYNEGMLHGYGVDLMDIGILTSSLFFFFFSFRLCFSTYMYRASI